MGLPQVLQLRDLFAGGESTEEPPQPAVGADPHEGEHAASVSEGERGEEAAPRPEGDSAAARRAGGGAGSAAVSRDMSHMSAAEERAAKRAGVARVRPVGCELHAVAPTHTCALAPLHLFAPVGCELHAVAPTHTCALAPLCLFMAWSDAQITSTSCSLTGRRSHVWQRELGAAHLRSLPENSEAAKIRAREEEEAAAAALAERTRMEGEIAQLMKQVEGQLRQTRTKSFTNELITWALPCSIATLRPSYASGRGSCSRCCCAFPQQLPPHPHLATHLLAAQPSPIW